MTLATDLDGTLLGGNEHDRKRLAQTMKDGRVIFVTGRALETIAPLLWDPLVPRPSHVIGDVGGTVAAVDGHRFVPVQPLQSQIDAKWPGALKVLKAVREFPGLERQDVPQERRVSFVYRDESVVSASLRERVQELGCDLLCSAGRYLDILPRGVTKGTTLLALLEYLSIDRAEVVVAGDTLNDLAMFHTGLQGVVVGNAEAALVEQTRDHAHIYHAKGEGAGGILEDLARRGHALTPTSLSKVPREDRDRQLMMVYHRLPFEEYRRSGKTFRRRPTSPNGIIPSLLGFFAEGRPGRWVGWSLQDSRDPAGFEENVSVDEAYPALQASRVALTKEDVDAFYKRFSKEAFWPVIFSFPSKAKFDDEQWQHFLEINQVFADRVARESEPGAVVWIHDYNLWMVPGLLRKQRPDLQIGFFHHTAFPPSDVFNMVPWRQQIVGSLLQCDYVGFHIPRYVENFVDVVTSNAPTEVVEQVPCAPTFVTYGCALGVDRMTKSIDVSGRRVRLGAHPVGIDVARIREILSQPKMRARVKEIREGFRGRTAILSIERLDYVKGQLEKIAAFERLLENNPDLHGKVELINVVPPAAPGMQVYNSLANRLDQVIGRVNGRFGRLDWTPIRYFLKSLPFEEVVAHYAACDVAWITPLRDGLNLVAKEYVAAKSASGTEGTLILSEFAGAAVELHGALLTNPFDAKGMTETLELALQMSSEERRERIRRLQQIVEHNDVHHWGQSFIDGLVGA